jgi:hypothetical protein
VLNVLGILSCEDFKQDQDSICETGTVRRNSQLKGGGVVHGDPRVIETHSERVGIMLLVKKMLPELSLGCVTFKK